jgi:hypothetical protein
VKIFFVDGDPPPWRKNLATSLHGGPPMNTKEFNQALFEDKDRILFWQKIY